ncbi:N-acetylgalactosamine-N,N'-diacetylbacillosaminyl-diphospho-undecaprenol 4-alpha-N-acetylgalactosaminyltransferase [Flavobacterium sp. AG291]|nr:N-acetylgalactosamine-N,N'-diacetylbacillosaminyl-diphospho-undecaprenol 4-alpha-N-acetylgalactosaminyltransferase [Flavobacterium sp. AG291]
MQQMSKKKICLVGDSLSVGGAERVMADLSNYFFSKGIEIHVVIVQDKITYSYSGELLNLGLYKKRGVINKIDRLLRLKNYLEKHDFDYVIDFRFKNHYLQELITNELVNTNKKVVFTIHSSILKYYIPENSILAKLLFRKAYGIVTVSDRIKQKVAGLGLSDNLECIYNPVIIDRIRLKMDADNAPEYKYVLAAGSMNHQTKQFDKLINTYALSDLPAKGIKLVILGEGKLKSSYVEQVNEMKLDDMIIFPGFKSNPFVFMKHAMFFILSSKKEGLGMVLIESLACGTPVISFDCDAGPSEIIQHRVNGLLIKDQDFDELRNGMNTMVEDEELYISCKQNALISIDKFSIESIGHNWLEFLKIEEK